MTDGARPLLVYDGSRRLFRRVAERLTADSDLQTVSWDAEPVQAFLEAQFDDRPFAFILVEGDQVHAGQTAVARLLRRSGADERAVRLAERAYPAVAGPFGRVVHGQAPADLAGTFPLDERAQAHLAPLRDATEIPVSTE
ncbi:hypothetical protein [Halosegnis sp.]|uniref:hypothetical protein n=1 Tax=Halosegnis sp. TaxID=2864959 RepID=UPI0035D4DFB3